MRTVKLYVDKDMLVCEDEKEGHVLKLAPSITIGSNNIILGIGETKPLEGGLLFWPIKTQPMSDESSVMFTRIVQHALRELTLTYGWRRFLMFAPKLEVHLGKNLIGLEVWFRSNQSEFGVSSLDIFGEQGKYK